MYGFGAPQALTVGGLGGTYMVAGDVINNVSVGCIIAHEAAVAEITTGFFDAAPGRTAGDGTSGTQDCRVMKGVLTAVVLPIGVPFFGLFTDIDLTSGKITAYNV